MTFASPLYLILMVFIPMMAWFGGRFFHHEAFFDANVKNRLQSHAGSLLRSHSKGLFFIALACAIIALARPQRLLEESHENEVVKMGMLAISLDVSQSMLANDAFPNRLSFAKLSIETMMTQLSDFKIALSAFSNDAFLVAPFSEDTASLQFLLKHLDQNSMSSHGSSIMSAIMSSEKLFQPFEHTSKDLLIVSDGGDGEDLDKAIEKAKQLHIRVHLYLVGSTKGSTITLGSGELLKDNKGNIVITKRYDGLQKLSIETGGVYVSTNGDSADITWLCEQIRLKVHKDNVSKINKTTAQELFYYPLALGLCSLFLALFPFHVKRFSWAFLLLLPLQPLHSGMLDFWEIQKANKAYETKDYTQAVERFSALEKEKKSAQTAYNLANALYQQKAYDKALALYQGIKTDDASLEYQRWHNMGNTLAQMHQIDEAIKAYEKALSMKEDDDTRKNLELLKKQKEEQQKQNQQKNKEKQDNSKKSEKSEKPEKPEQKPNEEKKDTQKSDKENTKEDKSQSKPKPAEEKKMSEQEAQKWERMLNNIQPNTKPMPLYKGEKHETDNVIRW
ncbi:MAG: VWA domain-containing protein [Sulfurospirillaceae bacterium]|nr:VWA domain-containing protein [Sulfurospirillaceae bacterium]